MMYVCRIYRLSLNLLISMPSSVPINIMLHATSRPYWYAILRV